jgi:alpha-L-rhamnosidase
VQWLYEDLAGFRPLEPGYRKIEFRPEIPSAGLDFVEASHESVRGTVATSWRRTPDGLEIEVTVPPNAEGRVLVPAPSPDSVAETLGGSAVAAARAPAVTFMGVEGGRVVYEVGSGRYRFRVQESRVR